MAYIRIDCPDCHGASFYNFESCSRCDGFGYVEHDTSAKYYWGLLVIFWLYFLFQVIRHFI